VSERRLTKEALDYLVQEKGDVLRNYISENELVGVTFAEDMYLNPPPSANARIRGALFEAWIPRDMAERMPVVNESEPQS